MYAMEEGLKKVLDNLAQTDKDFAKDYAKKNKNINECINYILTEVNKKYRKEAQKHAVHGVGVMACSDDDKEIIGWAIHYYHEDNVQIDVKDLNGISASAQPTPTKVSKPRAKKQPKAMTPKMEIVPKTDEEDIDDEDIVFPLF